VPFFSMASLPRRAPTNRDAPHCTARSIRHRPTTHYDGPCLPDFTAPFATLTSYDILA
jgi:hypothetical protein